MTDDDSASVKIPDALFETTDEDALREKRERQAIRRIEERLRAGEISVREADEELVELAMHHFEHLSEATQAAIRERGAVLLDANPELVESRSAIAEAYGAEGGNDEGAQ